MSKTTHTPGPWRMRKLGGQPMVYGVDGAQVANMREPLVPDTENEANARLIAAAPDLLAAIKEGVGSLAYAVMVLQAPEKSAIRENLADMKAAIAKATEGEG